jgi:hypothetical protein
MYFTLQIDYAEHRYPPEPQHRAEVANLLREAAAALEDGADGGQAVVEGTATLAEYAFVEQ